MIRERMILNRITQEKLVHYRQWVQNDRRNETLHSSISEKGIRGSFRGKSLEFSSMEKQMEELKAQGKVKSATYRQLMGRKMMYQNMLSLYELYDLIPADRS